MLTLRLLPLSFGTVVALVLAVTVRRTMERAPSAGDEHSRRTPHVAVKRADVVIIGSGLAGLMAAVHASDVDPSVRVLVLEQNAQVGGNSAKATSGMNVVRSVNGSDSVLRFVEDAMAASHHAADPKLLEIMAQQSEQVWDELQTRFGVELTDVTQLGGHSVPRSFRIPPKADGTPRPLGWTIIAAVKRIVLALPNVQVVTLARVTVLFECNDETLRSGALACIGVRAQLGSPSAEFSAPDASSEELVLYAPAVILASGGFCASRALLAKYAPQVQHLPTTNGAWARGDGLVLAERFHVGVRDLNAVQVHPTGFLSLPDISKDSVLLAPEALRGTGGILLSPRSGRRFANELAPRDVLTNLELQHGMHVLEWLDTVIPKSSTSSAASLAARAHAFLTESGKLDAFRESHVISDLRGGETPENLQPYPMVVTYLLMTPECVDHFGLGAALFYEKVGALHSFESASDAAAAMGISEAVLQEELTRYASDASSATGDRFGKTVFPHAHSFADSQRVWVGLVTPSLHYSMGGLTVNGRAELLDMRSQDPVPGLFGAGEVTGGVHGQNRLGGNALLECAVFGSIAGRNAAVFSIRRGN
ncbi:Fumarate reductase 1 [Porphyridium purpureum]|uniref:Fumarate reductase 1 n=1 Tax=Porphyridium purpureum TaxID=35688 RepID=A0A5J4ZA40_PORPP|nr:Fumarate reductase 1 [Porphyridium purpureum]|eukprot:POR5443..scf295_1